MSVPVSRYQGFELELLAPKSRTRDMLARALAKAWKGRVTYGLKYGSPGTTDDGRPIVWLTLACRVVVRGRTLVTLVDDLTIQDELDRDAPPRFSVITSDDLRIAALCERRSSSPGPDVVSLLSPLVKAFDATVDLEQGRVHDPWGNVLATVYQHGGERERVCEVVTAPLSAKERERVITDILHHAVKLGFTVPKEAALHVHFDATHWQSVDALQTLVRAYSVRGEELRKTLQPNPRSGSLGPFPDNALRVCNEAPEGIPFAVFAAALDLALMHKGCDINLLGVVQRFARQRTLELRAMGMALDAKTVLARADAAEAFLASLVTPLRWAKTTRRRPKR